MKIIIHSETVLTVKVSLKKSTAKMPPNTDSSESIREASVFLYLFFNIATSLD
jgi:hypothetical protein